MFTLYAILAAVARMIEANEDDEIIVRLVHKFLEVALIKPRELQ